tara:strand:+ start:17382 stop:18479 length:1098 start_codon:yes stop_codon:yes gene_type:complete
MSVDKQKITLFSVLILLIASVFFIQSEESSDNNINSSGIENTTGQQFAQTEHDDAKVGQKTVPSDKVLPYKSMYGPLPGTLEGTIMQQALVVDEEGNLRISSDLKRVFDFFLSTIEEEDLSVILNRIREYLDFSLDEPALSQAKEIMEQYVALKKALFDFEVERSESLKRIMDQSGDMKGETYLSLLKEQLDAQRDLRSLHLSPDTHEAFYSDEEVYDSYSLSRMEVKADKRLSEEEKQARFAEIDAQAPQEIVESRRESQVTDILKAKTQALKSTGASQQAIKALRTEMLGPEAAERFDVLDQERASWNNKIERYLQQRQAILNNDGLGEETKLRQVDALRQRDFDPREQIRLGVYERRADAVK